MVEYTIQNDLHSVCFSHFYQLCKVTFCTKDRIDFHVIAGIITVVGNRCKYRIQVNYIYAKCLQIINSFNNTLQVTAIHFVTPLTVTPVSAVRFICFLIQQFFLLRIFRKFVPVCNILIIYCTTCVCLSSIVAFIAIVETIREDLVDNCILHPVRSFKSSFVNN